ncbi:MAG: polyphenol oxidase family protein [Candidatus Andersenbacteria bacterium]
MIIHNWEISTVTNWDETAIITPKQTHGNTIISVSDCISGITEADAIYGDARSKPFGILTADCVPLVLITDIHAYAIHISRHTIVAGIVENIEKIIANKKEKIVTAYIGPHICKNCFAFEYIGEDLQRLINNYPNAVFKKQSKTHLDLDKVIQDFLEEQDILEKNITRDMRCTFETPELYSYKRWLTEGNMGKFPNMLTVVRRA